MSRQMSRRQIVQSLGTLAVGSAATVGAIEVTSQDASAQTSVDFEVTNTQYQKNQPGEIADVSLDATANIEWDVDFDPDGRVVRLEVSKDGEAWDMVDYDIQNSGISRSHSTSIDLHGSLPSTDVYDLSDFTIPEQQDQTETPLFARLRFELRNGSEPVVTDTAQVEKTITITNPKATGEATVTGQGEVIVTE